MIRNMVVRALGVDPQAWLEMAVGNASVTRIRVEADGKFKVISVGDIGHLPPNLRTGATGDPGRSLAIPVALQQTAYVRVAHLKPDSEPRETWVRVDFRYPVFEESEL